MLRKWWFIHAVGFWKHWKTCEITYIVIYEYYCCKIMNQLEIKTFAENDVGPQLQAVCTCMILCVDLFKFWTFCTKDSTPTWMSLRKKPLLNMYLYEVCPPNHTPIWFKWRRLIKKTSHYLTKDVCHCQSWTR
jgi:hypothetical protein